MPDAETPVSPRFERPITVVAADIDANGHANNVAYLRWAQEVAIAHWEAVVPAELAQGLSWVVLRVEIDYRAPAHAGQELLARTWLGAVTAVTTERFTAIVRVGCGTVLAEARTLWCAIDARTGRPRRIDPRIRAAFLDGLDGPAAP